MKSQITATGLLLLSSIACLPSQAQELSLVVLGEGQITASRAVELSRQVTLPATVQNGVTVAVWKKTPQGYLCAKTKDYEFGDCEALLRVSVRLQLNEFSRTLLFHSKAGKSPNQGYHNLLSNEEYEELKTNDFSGQISSILSEIYDVQAGTIHPDGRRRYKKELRLMVDLTTKEIRAYEIVRKYLSWHPPHN